MRYTSRLTFGLTVLAVCLSQLWIGSSAQATHITFSNISQSGQFPGDPAAPYGTPTIVGNSLLFTSPDMSASSNGPANIHDYVTDGFLSFSAKADNNTVITGLSLNESGGRSFFDVLARGTATTRSRVIAFGRIQVTELDHGATALTGPSSNYSIGIGFDQAWNRRDNPGAGILWDGSDFKNIAAALVNNGVSFTQGATAFDFYMDNQLLAVSERGTISFIDKKRIEFNVMAVPEPGTMLMSLVAMFGVMYPRRRRFV